MSEIIVQKPASNILAEISANTGAALEEPLFPSSIKTQIEYLGVLTGK
jgi:hypothetical protein